MKITALILSGILTLFGILTLAACGGDEHKSRPVIDAPTISDEAVETPETLAEDPYEVYLELAPDDAPEISREDAQLRALLGCEMEFAPGTVDAALAEAYADHCP